VSRVGKAPIQVPSGVEITQSGQKVMVKGSLGTLEHEIPEGISIRLEDSTLFVERSGDERDLRAKHGLTRALLANMVTGVSQGFQKQLEIVGVGYRAATKSPSKIEISLGYSHPLFVSAPEGVTFEVPVPTRVLVKGIDKQQVGQVAADIRRLRKPEPYKGKGVRYANEQVARKAGKAAK
jgi:large subunit ribosomal protein L6